jgi:hypothetical protein
VAAATRRLRWATSQRIGGVTELAVLAPIRKGTVPGERRTFEERLRATIANLARRHQQGIPNELDRLSTIHFGRLIIIRPEQYLLYSKLSDITYEDEPSTQTSRPAAPGDVPRPIDDYEEIGDETPLRPVEAPSPEEDGDEGGESKPPHLRSWLLTLVEFDGDLKAYMREIAQFIGQEFDRIFENCEEYPRVEDFDKFWIWIRRFQINTSLFYSTYPHLSVVRLRQLEAFKRRFDGFVARVRSPSGPTVRSMDELFDEFLRENQQYGSGFPSPGGTYPEDDDRRGARP